MSVEAVLLDLGLGQYADRFQENHIDLTLAADLTDTDLKEMGISSLGHRRRILTAFADRPATDTVVERRDVVIIFADLVGFTQMTQSMDAEDAYGLIQAFLHLVDDTVRQSGGTVERHLGDAVMAIFGAPLARGDEALRAVKFADRVHGLVADLGRSRNTDLKVRVGVAYGQVIVRSRPGEDLSVVGSSVNLAARLSSVAQAGETLLSTHVKQACGGAIRVAEEREHVLKGFDDPVVCYRLGGVTRDTPQDFIGRAPEIAHLSEILSATQTEKRGHLVLLQGEAGIGKSTLLGRWIMTASEAGFVTNLSHILDFGVAQTQAVRARLVKHLLDDTEVAQKHRLWLSAMAGLPISPPEMSIIDAATPEIQARNRQEAFAALLRAAAKRAPLLLAFEDAHWADEDMLELLAECSRLAADLPLIVVATTRIEGNRLDEDWLAQVAPTPVSTWVLGPLDEKDCRLFASAIAGDGFDIENAVRRSSGHPLYLEQLLRHGQEDTTSGLPHSIHTIIQARIDLLDMADRRATRAAAVLGQQIELDAIRHILEDRSYSAQSLVERRILNETDAGLTFHHALIRDCVYETVLREERKLFHRAAADWYADRNPALHADHLAQIEAPETAEAYLRAANGAATDRQYAEAVRLAAAGLPHAQAQDLRCKLLLAEADALFRLNRPNAAIDVYRRAAEAAEGHSAFWLSAAIGEITALRLVDRVDEASARIAAAEQVAEGGAHDLELSHLAYLRGSLLFPTGDFQASLRAHDRALLLAERVGNPERIADALSGRGDALYAQGRMSSARTVFDDCLELCEKHGLARIKAQNLFMRGTVRIYALDWDGALSDALLSADLARTIGNARAEVVSRLTASWVYAWTGKPSEAIEQAEIGLTVAGGAGALRFKPFLSEALGHAQLLLDQRDLAQRTLETAVSDMYETGVERFIGPWLLGSLALSLGPGERQRDLHAEAEKLLTSGAVGHNHYQFRRLAIDAAIEAGDRPQAAHQAAALENYTRSEPTRWSDREIARARQFSDG